MRNIPWTDKTCKLIGWEVIFVGSSKSFNIRSIFPKDKIEPMIIAIAIPLTATLALRDDPKSISVGYFQTLSTSTVSLLHKDPDFSHQYFQLA